MVVISRKEERIVKSTLPKIDFKVETIGRKKTLKESWKKNYKLIAIMMMINIVGIFFGSIPFWGIIIGILLSIISTFIGFKAITKNTVETIYEIHTKS